MNDRKFCIFTAPMRVGFFFLGRHRFNCLLAILADSESLDLMAGRLRWH